MYFKISCLVALLLSLAGHAYAQRRTVAESDIDELLKKATEARKNNSYRVKISHLVYNAPSSEPENSASSVTEYLPPDRSHTVAEQRASSGLMRTETIWIGKVKYLRGADGAWSIYRPPASVGSDGSGGGVGTGTPVKPSVEQKFEYLGDDHLNGKLSDLYQKVRTMKFERPGEKLIRIVTKRYWFSKQGLLLKEISEDRFKNSKTIRVMLTEYEYDPTIKIEAPIP